MNATPYLEQELATRTASAPSLTRSTKRRAALARAMRRMELQAIRERLALPPEKRMNFLRVRLPGGGSAL